MEFIKEFHTNYTYIIISASVLFLLFLAWKEPRVKGYILTSIRFAKKVFSNLIKHVKLFLTKAKYAPFTSTLFKVSSFIRFPALKFGPFTMLVTRVSFSLLCGWGIYKFLYDVLNTLFNTLSISIENTVIESIIQFLFALTGLIISYFLVKPDGERLTVPNNSVAVGTFLGKRFPAYLVEGKFDWFFRAFGINVSTEPLQATSEERYPNEFAGFPFMGERVLPIWNKDDDNHNIIVSNQTKNDNTVDLSVTITIQTYDPIKYMLSDDPIKFVADRARGCIRNAVNLLLDIDVAPLKDAFPALLYGKTVLVVFTVIRTENHNMHKIVRNRGGNALYRIVEPKEKIQEVKIKFRKKVETEGDKEMINASRYNEDEEMVVTELKLNESLIDAANGIGARLINVAIGDADLSPEMKKIAEKAAAVMLNRKNLLGTAISYGQVAEQIREDSGVDPQTAMLIASRIDGIEGINISHITSAAKKSDGSYTESDPTELEKHAALLTGGQHNTKT